MIKRMIVRLSLCLVFMLAGVPLVKAGDPIYVTHYKEDTIKGIRYFKGWIDLSSGYAQPSLPDFRLLGFTVVSTEGPLKPTYPDYITPDGKVIPNFHYALIVAAPNVWNGWIAPPDNAPSSYSGDIYIPDRIEGFLDEKDPMYVLDLEPDAMGEDVISVRTPIYASVGYRRFLTAANLQKVQIGAYYSVMYQAFKDCKKLQTVIFEQAPQVFTTAFSDSPDIQEIVLQSEENLPLLEGTAVFDDKVYTNATLYVPDTLMEACKKDPVWSKFSKIKSLKECNVELIKP